MCYSIPGKVIAVKAGRAIIDYFGEKREAHTDTEGVEVGDFVLAQGGVVVETVPDGAAGEILSSWQETFERLKARDLELSNVKPPKEGVSEDIAAIMERVLEGETLTKDEMLRVLQTENSSDTQLVTFTANLIRSKEQGNSACVHGIIEFSNNCSLDCAYCGIGKSNIDLTRYRLSTEEIIKSAEQAVKTKGFKALVLQSGEDAYYTTDKLKEIIASIKKRVKVMIALSIGDRGIDDYKALYEAGARGALMRFETSNEGLYSALHSSPLKERLDTINALKDMGYLVMTGSLFGLPGQSDEDIVDDMLLTKEIAPEMFSSGPFIPHPSTELGKSGMEALTLNKALRILALTRLIDKKGSILITTAFEKLFGVEGTRRALLSGGNSMMVNLTPYPYSALYSIYPGKGSASELGKRIEFVITLLMELGRSPSEISVRGAE
ncbi:MAG: radical SAM protein [Deltaproteobacteria bacterium]|nr:radical SAM protein [Deltaproteobacteria bacterium]